MSLITMGWISMAQIELHWSVAGRLTSNYHTNCHVAFQKIAVVLPSNWSSKLVNHYLRLDPPASLITPPQRQLLPDSSCLPLGENAFQAAQSLASLSFGVFRCTFAKKESV